MWMYEITVPQIRNLLNKVVTEMNQRNKIMKIAGKKINMSTVLIW